MKNHEMAFIITAFEQVELVERNIIRIRKEYPLEFSNSAIIIISTSENDLFSFLVKKYDNIHVHHYIDAPGNKISSFDFKTSINQNFIDWRHKFLPIRILTSIEKGLIIAKEIGCKFALHLHSDTYWDSAKIYNLLKDVNKIQKKLFIGDLSFFNELNVKRKKLLPASLHFQPEGLLFNISMAFETEFYKFGNIWIDDNFKSTNYGSTEGLIGQYAFYCLNNKSNCIISYNDAINSEYKDKIIIRTIRNYHGSFKSGLVNLELSQEKVKKFEEKDLIPKRPSIKQIIHSIIYQYEI